MFTRSKLAIAIMATASAIGAEAVFAEEGGSTEEVVVMGIRQSLSMAVDRKRDSDNIMDSIVAEDIGKFPDSNVAESLQRISGVSIDRAGGEGQSVTVRGFGPQFNTVLVNGRRIASDGQGRGFNFDLIPADLIGGADVFKSSAAHLQEGGIGSTINLRLQRPLQIGDFSAIVSARGVYDEQADEISPQAFALVSNTFADETVGALLSVSYQARESANDQVLGDQKVSHTWDAAERMRVFANDVGNEGVSTYARQRLVNYTRANQERDRLGLTGVLEFQPSDDLKLTVDGLYTEFEVVSQTINDLHFVDDPASLHNAVADENNVLEQYHWINRPFNTQAAQNRESELFQLGANLEWNINDSLTASFDISKSTAEDNNAGDNFFVVVAGAPVVQQFDFTEGLVPEVRNFNFTPSTVDTNGDGIVNEFDYTLGSEITVRDENDAFSWFSQREGDGFEDDITEFKADLTWEADRGALRSVSGGVFYSEQEKTRTRARSQGGAPALYLIEQVPIPANLVTPVTRSGFLSPVPGSFPTGIFEFDPEQILSYLSEPGTLDLRDQLAGLPPGTSAADFGDGFVAVPDLPAGFNVEEEITSAYINLEFGTDLGEMELTVNAGLRYTETEAVSGGFSSAIINLMPDPTRPDVLIKTESTPAPIAESASYDNTLPSISARLKVNDYVVLRAAYSKTLTRPDLVDMNPGVETPTEPRLTNLTGSGGNPQLGPYVSENWDFSSEFYFGESSLLSLGFFLKNIDGFIVRGSQREGLVLPTPNNLDDITEDRSNIEGDTIFFEISRPRNLAATKAYGAEISFQHTFDNLPGLLQYTGINANLTFVEGSEDASTATNTRDAVLLEGLGDSQNYVLFYDDGTFEARLAYNNRERFFNRLMVDDALFFDDYDQIDARFAWNFQEGMQVFVEGTNLEESFTREGGILPSRFGSLESSGSRYTVGVRASF